MLSSRQIHEIFEAFGARAPEDSDVLVAALTELLREASNGAA